MNGEEDDVTSKPSLVSGLGGGKRLRRDGGRAALLVCLAAFAAACGTVGGSAGPGYVDGVPQSSVAFARCMRAHGVPDFPDPWRGQFNLSGVNQNSPRFRNAVGICSPPGQTPGPRQQAQALAKALAFARCMRANGLPTFPDPSVTGAAGEVTVTTRIPRGSGVDPKSPVFQAAVRACRSRMHGSAGNGKAG